MQRFVDVIKSFYMSDVSWLGAYVDLKPVYSFQH